MMEYGFIGLNGVKWINAHVDVYNNLSAQIEQFPNNERLKDERHLFFVLASMKEPPKRARIGVLETEFNP